MPADLDARGAAILGCTLVAMLAMCGAVWIGRGALVRARRVRGALARAVRACGRPFARAWYRVTRDAPPTHTDLALAALAASVTALAVALAAAVSRASASRPQGGRRW